MVTSTAGNRVFVVQKVCGFVCMWFSVCGSVYVIQSVCGSECLWFSVCGSVFVVQSVWFNVCGKGPLVTYTGG